MRVHVVAIFVLFATLFSSEATAQQNASLLTWSELPPLPNELGLAGPIVGVHNGVLIVAGGANFPEPVWENEKQWHDDAYGLFVEDGAFRWKRVGKLPRAIAYGACVSTPEGIICVGGNDSQDFFADCFRLEWEPRSGQLSITQLPSLPIPLAYGQACQLGNEVYVAGGQVNSSLSSATQNLWSLNLTRLEQGWRQWPAWPGPPRAFNLTVCQNNGSKDCLYLIGGRYQDGTSVRFLRDCWEFDAGSGEWRERAPMPDAMSAGAAVAFGQTHVFVLSGDDGRLFDRSDELGDQHPGFPKRAFAYHTVRNSWSRLGESPSNQVTTTAVFFEDRILLPTGEIRPRVRTPRVWAIHPSADFGKQ